MKLTRTNLDGARGDATEVASALAEIVADFAELMEAGARSDDEKAAELAERSRLLLDTVFPCSPHTHVRIAEMYETDPRFLGRFEGRAEGLASFIADAIRANREVSERE